jgi:hypothetical protein
MLYREALVWRMAELSRGALESLEKENLSAAVILIRGAVETRAGLRYLRAKLDDAVTNQSKGDIDDYMMKLLMGSNAVLELPQAINVLTFVDSVNKGIEGFREQCDNLSEFAHPNWAGTSLLYSKSDPKNLWSDFDKNIRCFNSTKQAGAQSQRCLDDLRKGLYEHRQPRSCIHRALQGTWTRCRSDHVIKVLFR